MESAGPNLLLIDDELTLTESLAKIFNANGFQTLRANNADEAEKILSTHNIPLILCDVNMPGRSGLELLASLRASGNASAVVMVTAEEESQIIIEAMRLGAIDYILKPFDIDACLEKMPTWLEVGKRMQTLKDPTPQTADGLKNHLRIIELMRLKNFADGRAE